MLMSPTASFPLAREFRSRRGAPLGDVFSFLSGLYFRGKLTYGRRFARVSRDRLPGDGVLIITPSRGLLTPAEHVNGTTLREFAAVRVDACNPAYRLPLESSVSTIARLAGPEGDVVFLGSIASRKYTDVLGNLLGERLLFPVEFVGLGDMSRGALLLRAAAEGRELNYIRALDLEHRLPRPRGPRL
jgi:hypothetical protein